MPESKTCETHRVVLIGGAHLDESVRLQDALQPGESNRAIRSFSLGGVACNAAQAACPHVTTHLIAALGRDQAGQNISQLLQQTGVVCHFIYSDEDSTGQYTAVLDTQGELIIGLSSTEIAETLSAEVISNAQTDIAQRCIVAFDTNLSSTCIAELCSATSNSAAKPILAAIAVSPVKTMRLVEFGNHIHYLFANRSEAAMLTGQAVSVPLTELSAALTEMNFQQHVVTDGSAELLVRDAEGVELLTVVAQTTCPGNSTSQNSVNGAGDALAGASIAGLAMGLNLKASVMDLGLPAAAKVVSGQQNA